MIHQSTNRPWLLFVACLTWLLTLSACGFHLREPSPVPFKSVYVGGSTTLITAQLKKELQSKGITITSNKESAEAALELISEQNLRNILSLNGDGVVREYELYYRITYRTKVAEDATWSLPLVMESRRDFIYSDAVVLSKIGEEKGLLENMQTEVMYGIIRRLSALKKASN